MVVQIPAKKLEELVSLESCTVNPFITTSSAMICTAPRAWVIIDSLEVARVRASTPALAPLSVSVFGILHLLVIGSRRQTLMTVPFPRTCGIHRGLDGVKGGRHGV